MEREEEIIIIIAHLKSEIMNNNYQALVANLIIKNGKLLEKYIEELNEINALNK